VIATNPKLFLLDGEPILVDTGNDMINQQLSGYVKVTTGVKERLAYKVSR
jgi:predicted polyphosphate/ATP-dependent NAD kinase